MEVRFTVTLDDYVAFSLHAARKSRLMQVIFVFLWLLPPAIFVGMAALILLSDGLNGAAVIGGAMYISVGILWAIIFPFFFWGLTAFLTRAYAASLGTRGVTGEITLILLEDTLVEITEIGRTEVRWENMKGVDDAGDRTYIFVTGMLASILPRRGFDSDEEYFAARDFAMHKLVDERQERPDV